MSEQNTSLSEYIAENFGANASYVEGLLARFYSDPNQVDESWRTFFNDLLAGNNGAASTAQSGQAPAAVAAPAERKAQPEALVSADTNAKALVGASKKIVENMEQSLTIPTATSFRTIPVKLFEENRGIINAHLKAAGRGKVSFTHIIAWAIVKSAKDLLRMNQGYGLVNGAPSRIENQSINLGIAIDIEKKDGSRNLLVPNIKGSQAMNFAEFFKRLQRTGKEGPRREIDHRRFSGDDHFADQSRHARNRCVEPAPDVGTGCDHCHRCHRVPG